MNAFFLIDKPIGCTSFDVLRDMRRMLGIKKIGHSGTLDPLASGCLLVATGNYTKLIPYIAKADKSYIATILLDGTSPSYDTDTEIHTISDKKKQEYEKSISLPGIEEIIKTHFSGIISQVPPKYSALKISGKRALDRTLAGEDIKIPAREANIFSCEIIHFSYPTLKINIHVSEGTYIRSIAHDLGEKLGTGGYISALRRTKIGDLDVKKSIKISEISWEKQLPLENVFPKNIYSLRDTNIVTRLGHGQRVKGEFSFPEGSDLLLEDSGNILFVCEYKNGVLHPRKKI